MRPVLARDRLADSEKQCAEVGTDEVPHAGAEVLSAEPGEGDTLQETADLLGNLFRTSKEEAEAVQRGHEERGKRRLEQGESGQVRPNQK